MKRLAMVIGAAMWLGACAGGLPGKPPGMTADEAEAARSGQAPPVSGVTGEGLEALPPQTLASGECGLFFWTSAAPHRFVLFENESRQSAKILHEGRMHTIGVVPQRADFVTGDAFSRVYLDRQSNLVLTLTGEVGEEGRAGVLIERALLKARELDGTEIVVPVLGLRSCRTGMPVTPGSADARGSRAVRPGG